MNEKLSGINLSCGISAKSLENKTRAILRQHGLLKGSLAKRSGFQKKAASLKAKYEILSTKLLLLSINRLALHRAESIQQPF